MKRIAPIVMLAFCVPSTAWSQHEAHQGPAALAVPAPPAPSAESHRPPAREWTRQPLLVPAMVRGDRSTAILRPQGIEAAELRVFAADGPADRRELSYAVGPEGAKIQPATPKTGNYHWVIARQEGESEVRVASTVWYFSNPGEAPTELLKQSRHELEIIPAPLPREHGSYRESEKWRFQVRWRGQPLAKQPLTLETEFGSRSRVATDADGIAVVLFPRDFKPAEESRERGREEGRQEGRQESHGGPRRAKFVLATEKEDGGKRYLTAFNSSYSPDPDRERNLAWGAAFGLLGMVAATPLLRRRAATNDSGSHHA